MITSRKIRHLKITLFVGEKELQWALGLVRGISVYLTVIFGWRHTGGYIVSIEENGIS